MRYLKLFGLLLGFLTIQTCSNSDEDNNALPEIVQKSIGNYSYSGWFYQGSNWSNRQEITGVLTVSANGDALSLKIDEGDLIEVSRLVIGHSGYPKYGFDIEAAALKDLDDNSIQRVGIGDAIMQAQPYDGLYESDIEHLILSYSLIYENPEVSEPVTYFFSAYKN